MSDDTSDDELAAELRAEVDEVIATRRRGRTRIIDESVGDHSGDDSSVTGGSPRDDSSSDSFRPSRAEQRRERRAERRAERDEAKSVRRDEKAAKSAQSKGAPSQGAQSKGAQSKGAQSKGAQSKGAQSKSAQSTTVGGRQRVVISDDSLADGRSPKAPVVGESRFRKRRIDVNRSEGRRRLRIAVVVGSVLLVVIVVLVLLASPLLSIRTVNVEGVVYADPEAMSAVVDDLMGEPILTADLHQAELRLLAIPWVEDARVSMHLPSTVDIEVVEREPTAFFRAVDGFNRVIDRDGRVLDVIEGDPVDYPLIAGTGPSISAGQTVEQPFLGAAQLIDSLPSDLRARLESAAVTPEGDVNLALSEGVTVLFGRPDNFQAKLVGVINEIKRQGSSPYSVIDVSTGEPSVR